MASYTELSYTLTKQISKKEKRANGIFFTPPSTIQKNLDILSSEMTNVKTILEPSCGSCEYVLALQSRFKDATITGIESNQTIFDSIRDLQNDRVVLYHDDFLKRQHLPRYDLIIGNPPYFVMKKHQVATTYYDYFDGRPNIFILFIIKSLSLLKEGGFLSFVLPKSFLSCAYYTKTRQYISTKYKILHIIECHEPYIETKQDTICMIIQNTKGSNQSFMLHNTILGEPTNIRTLQSLYKDSTTLEKLGFKVYVGTVVWNQCKDILTSDCSKTRLIYSSDIQNNQFVTKTYKNPDKKKYIDKPGHRKPLLVLNRGYGTGSYSFDYCIIDGGFEYLVENHLICIQYTKEIDDRELILLYNKIIQSWKHDKTRMFIQLYIGNHAMNTKELATVLPIYDI